MHCNFIGDLTDAKDETLIGSSQYIEEWKEYAAIITYCQQGLHAKWLDVRGNHGKLRKIRMFLNN